MRLEYEALLGENCGVRWGFCGFSCHVVFDFTGVFVAKLGYLSIAY
jgi:hypothetical protein